MGDGVLPLHLPIHHSSKALFIVKFIQSTLEKQRESCKEIWYICIPQVHRLPSANARAGQSKTNKILFLISLTFCLR